MNQWDPIELVHVGLSFDTRTIPVGRLARRDRTIFFEYDAAFVTDGLDISPFELPRRRGVMRFDPSLFGGLPGVFDDSLPDGWGRLLMDRALRGRGIAPGALTPLDRLALVGMGGMGALVYEPDRSWSEAAGALDLDELAGRTTQVLQGASEAVLDELIGLNGSSAGARPKVVLAVDETRTELIHGRRTLPEGFEHWLVKFPTTIDGLDAGAVEYVYHLMAREAGVEMAPCHLFPAERGAGYFGTKRFDRVGDRRVHLHTAAGLLHADFRVPALDYEDILALTHHLTRDIRQVEAVYRIAVFNVLAHNRDDHGKNFGFLMGPDGRWRAAPAYDLTFSSGPGGQQSTMVMGEGKAPTIDHLLDLAKAVGLAPERARDTIDQARGALSRWEELARHYGVARDTRALVGARLLS